MPGNQQITIDLEHQYIHEGVSYTETNLFTGVANEDTRSVRVVATTKAAHLIIQIGTSGKAYWRTYSGTSYTADGTEVTGFNRLVSTSARTPATLTYLNPTVDVLGTLRGERLVPAGTGGNSSGAASGSRIESVIVPGNELLIVVENQGGTAKDIEIVLDWYETANQGESI